MLLFVAIPVGIRSLSSGPSVKAVNESPRSRNADYIGSQSCRDCHPGEAAAHAGSGHARTLRPVARTPFPDRLDGVKVVDPEEPAVTWSYRRADGKLAAERTEAGAVERMIIDYAFGSGHHATTFATMTDRTSEQPTMIEHHMTVFAVTSDAARDITPGQCWSANMERDGTAWPDSTHGHNQYAQVFRMPFDHDIERQAGQARRGDDDPERWLRKLPRPGAGPCGSSSARGGGSSAADAGRTRALVGRRRAAYVRTMPPAFPRWWRPRADSDRQSDVLVRFQPVLELMPIGMLQEESEWVVVHYLPRPACQGVARPGRLEASSASRAITAPHKQAAKPRRRQDVWVVTCPAGTFREA